MLLTEDNSKWQSIIKEELNVTSADKLNWMSKYAQIHELKEAQQNPAQAISGGLFATPLNTIGMGNPAAPQGSAYGNIGNTGADFHAADYKVGSGDLPMSTLPIALTVAAQTIAFDLVPVIPATGSWAMLQYFDTPYAGGKTGRFNETILDGKGDADENKPIYIKVKSSNLSKLATIASGLSKNEAVTLTSTGGNELKGIYLQSSRVDAGLIIKIVSCTSTGTTDLKGNAKGVNPIDNVTKDEDRDKYPYYAGTDKNISIAEFFTAGGVKISGSAESTTVTEVEIEGAVPELVDGNADHIQEFQNFASETSADLEDPMTRAENETGVGNTVGARIFSKMVQMGSYEVTGTVTRQQLQDMPLYGIDVVGKILEQMQNRISQAINNRILDRLFKLGVENAKIQKAYQGIDLSCSFITTADTNYEKSRTLLLSKLKDINGDASVVNTTYDFKPVADINSEINNYTAFQRRISSRMLAAANIIANVSRRGRGNFVVTNTQILSALQDAAGFIVAPMTNTLTQDGSQSLYFAGSIAGLNVYVDPNMQWNDTRILVGKKGNGEEPGVVFMPYILADTVQTIVEGTMAPKLLINSRFAIVDAGFYPEQSYYAFGIIGDGAII